MYTAGARTFSISAWIYTGNKSFDGQVKLIADDSSFSPSTGGFWIGIDDRGGIYSPINGIRFAVGLTGGLTSGVKSKNNLINSTRWYHIVGTYNGTASKIWINGADETGNVTNTGTGDYLPKNANLTLGSANSKTLIYNGTIDDVQIWNRSLSAEEIKFLFENKTNMLSSEETETGDVWQANITINDGLNDSKSVESNYLSIL